VTITSSSVLQRDPGATVVVAPYGPRGPVISGTSSSSVAVGLGTVTFAMTEYGLGFAPGIRLRASAIGATNQWVEGVVSTYINNVVTIPVDLFSGSGIYASWQVSVAGQPGVQGPIGPVGATGPVPEAPQDSNKYARLNAAWYNITADFALKAPLASPAFTGTPTAPTPATATNNTTLANTAYVQNVVASYQPLDADLTAIAALTGINTIYYRSAANTWAAVTIGSGISFTGGVISAAAGGGNVSNSGVPVAGQLAVWINTQQIQGVDGTTLYAPVASPTFTGDPKSVTPPPGDNDTSIATTAFVAAAIAPVSLSAGRLSWVSATALSFLPYNGDRIKINGTVYGIPAAGIVGLANTGVFVNGVAAQNLLPNSQYFVYAFNNGGVITADFSTTGHATSAAAGNVGTEIKSGDNTRTLIGMIRANNSSQFQDDQATRFVLSWFNRRNKKLVGADTGGVQSNSTTAIELGGGNSRVWLLTWGDDDINLGSVGTVLSDTVTASVGTYVFGDNVNLTPRSSSTTNAVANGSMPTAHSFWATLSEGYHYLAPFANITAGTGTFYIILIGMIRG
jgi:hypothetical protein